MLVLRGAPAHSEFRLRKLEQLLLDATGQVMRVYAEHMHFVDSDRALPAEESVVLERLLRYGPHLRIRHSVSGCSNGRAGDLQ